MQKLSFKSQLRIYRGLSYSNNVVLRFHLKVNIKWIQSGDFLNEWLDTVFVHIFSESKSEKCMLNSSKCLLYVSNTYSVTAHQLCTYDVKLYVHKSCVECWKNTPRESMKFNNCCQPCRILGKLIPYVPYYQPTFITTRTSTVADITH